MNTSARPAPPPRPTKILWLPRPQNRCEWTITVLAVIVRIAVLTVLAADPQRAFVSGDGREYWTLSQSFLSSGTLVFPEFGLLQTPFTRTPGYPLFLACIRAACPGGVAMEIFAVALVQSGLSLWLILLAFRMASIVWGENASQPLLLLFFSIFALDPGFAVFGALIMSEMPFAFLWTVTAALLLHAVQQPDPAHSAHSTLFAASLTLSTATLFRPIGQFLILPALAAIAWSTWKNAGIQRACILTTGCTLVFAAPLGAWALRNAAMDGPLAISSVPSVNLLLYAEELERPGAGGDEVWAAVQQKADSLKTTHPAPRDWFHAMAEDGKSRILSDPARLLSATLNGCIETAISPPYALLRFAGWTDDEIAPLSHPDHIVSGLQNAPGLTLFRLVSIGMTALLSASALLFFLSHLKACATPWLLTLACWAMLHTGLSALSGGGRMRIPILAWIVLFASGWSISGFRLRRTCSVMDADRSPIVASGAQ